MEFRRNSRRANDRRELHYEENMTKSEEDDVSAVQEFGHEPWKQPNWDKLFEQVAGRRDLPLPKETLSQVMSVRYNCTPGLAEAVLELAQRYNELTEMRIYVGEITWTYYFNKVSQTECDCQDLFILPETFCDPDSLLPKPVRRDELKSSFADLNRLVDGSFFDRVIESMEYMKPVLLEEDEVRLHPDVSHYYALTRLSTSLTDEVGASEITGYEPALNQVVELLDKHAEVREKLSTVRLL